MDAAIGFWKDRCGTGQYWYWHYIEKSPLNTYNYLLRGGTAPYMEAETNIMILKAIKKVFQNFIGGLNYYIGTFDSKEIKDIGVLVNMLLVHWKHFATSLELIEVARIKDLDFNEASHKFQDEDFQNLDVHSLLNDMFAMSLDTKSITQNFLKTYGIPSSLKRNWMFYTISASAGLLALFSINKYSKYIYTLFDIVKTSKKSVLRFIDEHLVDPLKNIYKIIRYDNRNESIVTQISLDQNTESLSRMVTDFVEENKENVDLTIIAEQARLGNIAGIMEAYEKEIQRPIKNALLGDLVRLVLIQVQKQKVDVEKAMIQIDKLLKQNEINFQIMAVFPVLILLFIMWKFLTSQESPQTKRHSDIRIVLRQVSVLVNRSRKDTIIESFGGIADTFSMSFEDYGEFLIYLDKLEYEARCLYDSTEKVLFINDIKELVTMYSTEQWLTTLQRMISNYAFLTGK